ncbi:hypothetical protein ACH6EH_11105 [Paenibacillus sp. JSM ZJ436]
MNAMNFEGRRVNSMPVM